MPATEDAALCIQRTVPVWTGETGVNRDALYLAAKDLFQLFGKGVVPLGGHAATRQGDGTTASQGTFVWQSPQPVWGTPYSAESFSGAVP